nr:hypothetical protein [Anseongella ginsenosidimutans]
MKMLANGSRECSEYFLHNIIVHKERPDGNIFGPLDFEAQLFIEASGLVEAVHVQFKDLATLFLRF